MLRLATKNGIRFLSMTAGRKLALYFTVDGKCSCQCTNKFSALYLKVNWVRLDLLRLGTQNGIRFLSMTASGELA